MAPFSKKSVFRLNVRDSTARDPPSCDNRPLTNFREVCLHESSNATEQRLLTPTSTLTNLHLGTAPDSWGVWFPDDPRQVPWQQFLDEAAAAGYTAVALGPFGYLPTNPERLRDELGRRGLTLTGATAGTALHRGADALAAALVECRQIAGLLAEMNAPYLITLPAMYTDLYTGELTLKPPSSPTRNGDCSATVTPNSGGSSRTRPACGRSSTRTPTPTSTATPPSTGSSRSPVQQRFRCVWTPATSPTPAATTRPS